jgi:hypothetical protein
MEIYGTKRIKILNMAISQNIFEKFFSYLEKSDSVLELGNQTFVRECVDKYQDHLLGYTNLTPVKKFVESLSKKHVSIDITGLDGSLALDLNDDEIYINDKFDLITNFGTTEHVEPNQFQVFKHIHNLCKIDGIMIHEVPVYGHWPNHCRFYYDDNFFIYLSEKNNYDIIDMCRIFYEGAGDLIFVDMKKKSDPFLSEKEELESKIKVSNLQINIPQYWLK